MKTAHTAMPTGLKRGPRELRSWGVQTLPAIQALPLHHLQLLQASTLLQTAAAKDTIQQILEQTHRQQGLCIAAYVLMPEHVHLLTDEPAKDTLATFLQILKQLTSRQLKSPDQKQFWQRRYYDFNVSIHEKYVEKLQYIHRNPVKRGLVLNPEDYRGCSLCPYVHSSVIRIRELI